MWRLGGVDGAAAEVSGCFGQRETGAPAFGFLKQISVRYNNTLKSGAIFASIAQLTAPQSWGRLTITGGKKV